MNYEDPMKAFEQAIKDGRLSADENSKMYAGHYMYMFTDKSGVTQFKHNDTRKYLSEE